MEDEIQQANRIDASLFDRKGHTRACLYLANSTERKKHPF